MRKPILLLLAIGIALAVAVGFWLRATGDRWTTSSPRRPVGSSSWVWKRSDATTPRKRSSTSRAPSSSIRISPWPSSLLQRTRSRSGPEWDRRLAELREVDPDELTARESFLLRYGLAGIDGDRQAAERILDEYLQRRPNDAFALEIRCSRLWREDRTEKAGLCYRKILDIEPNWVQAENRLGYLAMRAGRFREAEEHFRTYRFIAPDQANPHDSLGELLILRGRYPEAAAELTEAVTIRSDFCSPYANLLAIELYTGRSEQSAAIVDQATASCDEDFAARLACRAEISALFVAEDWPRLAASAPTRCLRREPDLFWMVHRGAVLAGELQVARTIEQVLAAIEEQTTPAVRLHLEGVRRCAEGDPEEAVASFESADRHLTYAEPGRGDAQALQSSPPGACAHPRRPRPRGGTVARRGILGQSRVRPAIPGGQDHHAASPARGIRGEYPSTMKAPIVLALCLVTPSLVAEDPVLWTADQRSFLQDGPALLLQPHQRQELLLADAAERAATIERFLGRDPLPGTPENELQEGIRRRRSLVDAELDSPLDDRARLLFLHGRPLDRRVVECREVFKPLEIWRYPTAQGEIVAVLYRLGGGSSFRLWLPGEGKRLLYTGEMSYLLEQWHDLGRSDKRRFDDKICPVAREVDAATGIRGLGLALHRSPPDEPLRALLEPPDDLAAWAREAVATTLPEPPPALEVSGPEISFPAESGLRILTRFSLTLPSGAELDPVPVDDASVQEEPRGRLSIDGVVERDGRFFEEFRVLFEPLLGGGELPLTVDRLLRGGQSYLVRLRLRRHRLGAAGATAPGIPDPPGDPRRQAGRDRCPDPYPRSRIGR